MDATMEQAQARIRRHQADMDVPEAGRLVDLALRSPDLPPEKLESSMNWASLARMEIASKVPPEYRDARTRWLDDDTAAQVEAIEWTRRGVLLSGKTGTGKTYAATAIAIDTMRPDHPQTCCADGRAWSFCWLDAPTVLCRIRSTFRDRSDETELSIMKELVGYQTLVLDDLGAEKITDWSAATLYAIIAKRRNYQRLTIVTTNQTLAEINAWEPRMASRLAEFSAIDIKSQDRRIANA